MHAGGASVATRVLVLIGILVLPALSLASGSVMFVPLFALPAMFIVSGMLFGGGDPPPERPDADDSGGGGGPRRPHPPESPPSTGPPLPDADMARARSRDHTRGPLAPAPTRRGAPREPVPKRIRPRR
ncbi:MAG TPA: hypothetical protein VMB27_00520 [Solirubrobacteraceae bacterium]|nr:hypothetical protein [Solirubrobacteraceae bacterium]